MCIIKLANQKQVYKALKLNNILFLDRYNKFLKYINKYINSKLEFEPEQLPSQMQMFEDFLKEEN